MQGQGTRSRCASREGTPGTCGEHRVCQPSPPPRREFSSSVFARLGGTVPKLHQRVIGHKSSLLDLPKRLPSLGVGSLVLGSAFNAKASESRWGSAPCV